MPAMRMVLGRWSKSRSASVAPELSVLQEIMLRARCVQGVGVRMRMYVLQVSLKEEGKEPLVGCEGTLSSCPECRTLMVAPPRWAAGLSKGPEGLVRALWDTWRMEGGTEDSSGAESQCPLQAEVSVDKPHR